MRLRFLIFLVLTLISAIPVMLLGYWVQQTAIEKEVASVEEKHLIIAQNLSNAFERYASDTRAVFAYVSRNFDMINKLEGVDGLLNSMGISELCTVDNQNQIIGSLNKNSICKFSLNQEKIDRLRVKAMNSPGKVSFSKLRRIDDRPVFFLVSKINDSRFAVGTLETNYLRKIQKSISFGERGHSMIVDGAGRVIAHPNENWESSSKDASKLSVVQKMMQGETGVSMFYSPPMAADMIAGHTAVPGTGWGVMVPQPYSELIDHAGSFRWAVFAITILGITFAAILGWVAARALSNPITRVCQTARAIASGDSKVRVTNISRYTANEVRDLANSFNLMIGKLRSSHEDLQRHRDNLEHLVNERTNELRQQKINLDTTLASIGDGVITTDSDQKITYLNPVAEKLTGWTFTQCQGQKIEAVLEFLDIKTGEPMELLAAIEHEADKTYDSQLKRTDDSTVDVQKTVAKIEDSNGRIMGTVIVVRDVTENRKLSEKLSYEATHDSLTGLVNRRAFEKLVDETLIRAHESQGTHSLCYIDLDRFKQVNDSCGHAAGDELLQQVSTLMKQQLRQSDTLARLGGDEFGVLLADCGFDTALTIAEKIRHLVETYRFNHDDQPFQIGASIGVVEITENIKKTSDIFKAADSACYLAKKQGRNRVEANIHPISA